MSHEARRVANVWVAYLMPILIVGLVTFASWVFIAQLCVRHISIERNQTSEAIGYLVVYCVLLCPLAVSYFRAVITVNVNPGFVQLGPPLGDKFDSIGEKNSRERIVHDEDPENGFGMRSFTETTPVDIPPTRSETSLTDVLRQGPPQIPSAAYDPQQQQRGLPATLLDPLRAPSGNLPYSLPYASARPPPTKRPGNLREFINKEIYVCEEDGLPRWCGQCNCWKPDRAHHCSEVNRCVWRFDHFCPWVGGVVGETSYKFFCQVIFYALLYCLFVVIVCAVYVNSELRRYNRLEGTWLATTVLAGFFGLFSIGMTLSTGQLILRNQSTVDSLSASSKVYQLAIHEPNPPFSRTNRNSAFPRVWLPPNPNPGEEQRCFVIVKTRPGENPWLLDSTLQNIHEALCTDSVWSWLTLWGVPKPGSRGGQEGFYKWNKNVIKRLKKEAGITQFERK